MKNHNNICSCMIYRQFRRGLCRKCYDEFVKTIPGPDGYEVAALFDERKPSVKKEPKPDTGLMSTGIYSHQLTMRPPEPLRSKKPRLPLPNPEYVWHGEEPQAQAEKMWKNLTENTQDK